MFNSLGYRVSYTRRRHRHEALMLIARGPSGAVVAPDDVDRGLNCNCVCVHCSTPLVAKQGDVRVWHFAHASGAQHCSKESWWSKQALDFLAQAIAGKYLQLPHTRYLLERGRNVRVISCSIDEVTFDRSFLRLRVVDEALAGSAEERNLAIRIEFGRSWGGAADQEFRCKEIPSIEVDLRNWVTRSDSDIVAGLCEMAERRWLWISRDAGVPTCSRRRARFSKGDSLPIDRPSLPLSVVAERLFGR